MENNATFPIVSFSVYLKLETLFIFLNAYLKSLSKFW